MFEWLYLAKQTTGFRCMGSEIPECAGREDVWTISHLRTDIKQVTKHHRKESKLSFLIANQMQFETEKLTHRAFPSLGYAFENFVNMYSLVLADTQWCTVNKAYVRAFAQEDLLDKQG